MKAMVKAMVEAMVKAMVEAEESVCFAKHQGPFRLVLHRKCK